MNNYILTFNNACAYKFELEGVTVEYYLDGYIMVLKIHILALDTAYENHHENKSKMKKES